MHKQSIASLRGVPAAGGASNSLEQLKSAVFALIVRDQERSEALLEVMRHPREHVVPFIAHDSTECHRLVRRLTLHSPPMRALRRPRVGPVERASATGPGAPTEAAPITDEHPNWTREATPPIPSQPAPTLYVTLGLQIMRRASKRACNCLGGLATTLPRQHQGAPPRFARPSRYHPE